MNKIRKKLNKPTGEQWVFMLIFGLIPFLLFLYITFLPMARTVVLSFYDNSGTVFVGFKNYISLLSEGSFFKPMLNDFLILILKEIMVVVLAVLFAICITRLKFGNYESGFYRFIFYLPVILSVVIISKVWKYFFDLDLFGKIFNLKMPSNGWINKYPVPIISFVATWCGIGTFMIILITSINNISKELYEAADLEGASQWKQLFAITLPAIMPQIRYMAVAILTSIVASNTNFVKLFMGDSSGGSGFTVMGVYEYNSFDREQYDIAYPSAVIITLIVFVISYVLNKLIKMKEDD